MKADHQPDVIIPRWKRCLDLGFILLTLPLHLVLGLLIALLIRLVSAGPVLFRQERVGHRGQKFMLLKFRTMQVGSDPKIHRGHLDQLLTSNQPMVKMDSQGDHRIIPLGVWLRSSGLDELPQLINVFKGEMSLVGPRPCMPYEIKMYQPWQMERFNCLPGLTGLWQVSGKNNTTFLEMIQMDIEYSRRLSLGLDLAIMLKTVPALLVQMWEMQRRHHHQPTGEAADKPEAPARAINKL